MNSELTMGSFLEGLVGLGSGREKMSLGRLTGFGMNEEMYSGICGCRRSGSCVCSVWIPAGIRTLYSRAGLVH